MAIRTSLLNWNNIARDTDFSKYIETVSEPGVIEWLTVTSTKVAIWKARVPCLRTNGETIFSLVTVTSEVTISGNGDVFIEVNQTYIDNGELANEDWTGIATIQVWTMPAKNALKLATISNGVVTDARNMIAKVWELKTYIQSLNSRMNTAEQKIDQIIEDKAVDHLEETGLVWEKYTLANTLFKQLTPTFANSTVDSNIWDTDANKQIHIQRLATGTASNKLKLKAKKIWAPTTWLVVEVRRWVQVDVSDTEAYWYWNELVCSGSIPYSSFSTDYQEFEVTMNGQFGGTKWEKLDIVVYQTWNIVNSTNYYAIACDSTQYSEWFSFVAVNGSTRTRSKLMPYCIADGFAQSMLCKTKSAGLPIWSAVGVILKSQTIYGGWTGDTIRYDSSIYSWTLTLNLNINTSYVWRACVTTLYKNWTSIASYYTESLSWNPHTITWITLSQWDTIYVTYNGSWYCEYSIEVSSWTVAIPWSSKAPTMKVNKVFWIWELFANAGATLWNFEWDFYLWDDTITSVDTWNIALWNAVWFIKIWKYKIPYYL